MSDYPMIPVAPMPFRDNAACRIAVREGTAIQDWWIDGNHGPKKKAKAICATCPVIVECKDWAIKHGEAGVWGGTTERERRGLRCGQAVDTRCEKCDTVFVWIVASKRPLFCSDCRAVEARRRKRAHDVENRVEKPGALATLSLEAGHGLISRYNRGCRCKACRQVSAAKGRKRRARQAAP